MPDPIEHFREAVEEAIEHHEPEHGSFRARTALLLTVLAVALAVTALFVQRAIKTEIIAAVQVTGTRGSIETATVLQADNLRAAQELGAVAQLPGLPAAEQTALMNDMHADQAAAADEASDPQTKGGAKELVARQDLEQQDFDHAEEQALRLEYGEVFLEVALVLGSLAVLLVQVRLLYATGVCSGIGVVLALSTLLI
jgi:hypothetical protein